MKKYLIPALLSLFAMLGRNNVAMASEGKTIVDDAATIAVRSGALATKLVVNVPLSIGKSISKSTKDINDKIRGDLDLDDSPVSVAVATVPAAPAGITYGLISGTVDGTKESLVTYRDLIDVTFWHHVGFNVE